MSKQGLPVFIDPLQLSSKVSHLRGQLPVCKMKRLLTHLSDPQVDNKLSIAMDFGIDYDGRHYIKGKMTGNLPLICQRCLQLLDFEIDIVFNLSPVKSDAQAKRLPNIYDPLLVSDEPLKLIDLIEDELLINLPLIPRHDRKQCN